MRTNPRGARGAGNGWRTGLPESDVCACMQPGAWPGCKHARGASMLPSHLYLGPSGSSSSSLVGFLNGLGLGLYSPVGFLGLLKPCELLPPPKELLPPCLGRGVSSSFLKSELEWNGVSDILSRCLGGAVCQPLTPSCTSNPNSSLASTTVVALNVWKYVTPMLTCLSYHNRTVLLCTLVGLLLMRRDHRCKGRA